MIIVVFLIINYILGKVMGIISHTNWVGHMTIRING